MVTLPDALLPPFHASPQPSTEAEAALALLTLSPTVPAKSFPPSSQFFRTTLGHDHHEPPLKRKRTHSPSAMASPQNFATRSVSSRSSDAEAESTEKATVPDTGIIRCICSFDDDDGSTIFCDGCGIWQHMSCVLDLPTPPVVPVNPSTAVASSLPEEWFCERCVPRNYNSNRARAAQVRRREAEKLKLKERDLPRRRRTTTSGDPPEGRRRSTAPSKPGKVKAVLTPPSLTFPIRDPSPSNPRSPLNSPVPSLMDPWAGEYVFLDINTFLLGEESAVRKRIQRWEKECRQPAAENWSSPNTWSWMPVRFPSGDPLHSAPGISVRPLPLSSSLSISSPLGPTSPSPFRPPQYGLFTTTLIPVHSLLCTYPSTLCTLSTYISSPTSQYPLLTLPKPFVRLVGGPLGLALDAREAGGEARWVRSGCRPNAVVRPTMIAEDDCSSSELEDGVTFALFAMRDIRPKEEIIVGWEWDDRSPVHDFGGLLKGRSCDEVVLRLRLTNILSTLSGTFTTCACPPVAPASPRASSHRLSPALPPSDCVFSQVSRFLASGHGSGQHVSHIDLGPCVGAERGVSMLGSGEEPAAHGYHDSKDTNGRHHPYLHRRLSQGFNGTTIINIPVPPQKRRRTIGASEAVKMQKSGDLMRISSPLSVDGSEAGKGDIVMQDGVKEVSEDSLPPRLRKGWMKRACSQFSKVSSAGRNGVMTNGNGESTQVLVKMEVSSRIVEVDVDGDGDVSMPQQLLDAALMPPPPLPASWDPTTITSIDAAAVPSPTRSRSRTPTPPPRAQSVESPVAVSMDLPEEPTLPMVEPSPVEPLLPVVEPILVEPSLSPVPVPSELQPELAQSPPQDGVPRIPSPVTILPEIVEVPELELPNPTTPLVETVTPTLSIETTIPVPRSPNPATSPTITQSLLTPAKTRTGFKDWAKRRREAEEKREKEKEKEEAERLEREKAMGPVIVAEPKVEAEEPSEDKMDCDQDAPVEAPSVPVEEHVRSPSPLPIGLGLNVSGLTMADTREDVEMAVDEALGPVLSAESIALPVSPPPPPPVEKVSNTLELRSPVQGTRSEDPRPQRLPPAPNAVSTLNGVVDDRPVYQRAATHEDGEILTPRMPLSSKPIPVAPSFTPAPLQSRISYDSRPNYREPPHSRSSMPESYPPLKGSTPPRDFLPRYTSNIPTQPRSFITEPLPPRYPAPNGHNNVNFAPRRSYPPHAPPPPPPPPQHMNYQRRPPPLQQSGHLPPRGGVPVAPRAWYGSPAPPVGGPARGGPPPQLPPPPPRGPSNAWDREREAEAWRDAERVRERDPRDRWVPRGRGW